MKIEDGKPTGFDWLLSHTPLHILGRICGGVRLPHTTQTPISRKVEGGISGKEKVMVTPSYRYMLYTNNTSSMSIHLSASSISDLQS